MINETNNICEIIFVGFSRSHGSSPNHIQDVQFAVEVSNSLRRHQRHSENVEIEYIWGVQMTAATIWISAA